MTTIVTQETITAHGVDVTLLIARNPSISGPWSVTGLHPDGRRFVAVSEGTDDETITRRVRDAALANYDDRQHWLCFTPTDADAPLVTAECAGCGDQIAQGREDSVPDGWSPIWIDRSRSTVCPETGRAHTPRHSHTYRSDLSSWWCQECDTATDFCQQINPF